MTKRCKVDFAAKVVPVKPINDEFTLCKCYVMALNKNRNLSYIGQDAADAALPTLFNIPVIGHLYVDEQGQYHMGGHDMIITKGDDGEYKFQSVCVPYGVVPQQEGVHYEDIEEPNGDVHTYLVADVILWTGRFPELYEAVYNDKTYFGQSMEINITDYEPLEEDKNYTNILGYSYSALCLLGKSDNPDFHTEPCFPLSRVDAYEFSAGDEQFVALMAQLKEELAFCFDDTGKKGGEGMNENETVVVDEAVPNEVADGAENEVEVPTEDFSADEESMAEDGAQEEDADNGEPAEFSDEPDSAPDAPAAFSTTYKEKRTSIMNALPNYHEVDDDGNVIREVYFWLCDFDDVYAFVERNEYVRDTGCTETKGRFSYTFDDDTKVTTINGDMEEMFVRWITADELDQLEAQRTEYESLVQYKEERMRADHEAAIDAASTEFNDLAGNEEFENVMNNKYSYNTVDAFKDACYLIRGKFSAPQKPNKRTMDIPVPVCNTVERDIYESFFAKYGNKK